MIRLFVAVFLALSACAPTHRGFARVLGSADHLEIPVYKGTPPVIYTHVKLGDVKAKGGAWSSLAEQKYRALYNLSKLAQDKGANAVIDLKGQATAEGYTYTGTAVKFDTIPN